jgi:hypothetical protein
MAEIKKAVGIFEEIIAHQEESLSKNVITTRRERAVLNGSRAHLSSALELLGKVAVKACLNSGVAVCVP